MYCRNKKLRAQCLHTQITAIMGVGLWLHCDVASIHEFLVLRTSFVTRQQMKDRKALEGRNFVTTGYVCEL